MSYFYSPTKGATSGGTAITCVPPVAAGTCTWDTRNVPAGRYFVYVRARDALNTTLVPSDTAVLVSPALDVTAPSSRVTAPANGGAYGVLGYLELCDARAGDVCGTAADAASGVAGVEVSIRRDADGRYWDGSAFASSIEVFNAATGTTSWAYPLARPADGSYTIRSRAGDGAGNLETPGSGASFVIDTVRPSAKVVVPAATRTRTIAVQVTGADSEGVAGYFVSEASTRPSAGAGGWTSQPPKEFTLSNSDGRKVVYAWTKDAAGNVSATASDSVRLDATRPVLSLETAPFARSPKLQVQLTASDAGGIAGYYIALTRARPRPNAPGWTAAKPGSFTLPSATDGRKALFAWAKDAVGNISRPAVARLLLDTRLPAVRVGVPKAGSTLASLTRIRGVTNDAKPSSGLRQAEFAIRAADCSWWNPATSKFVPGDCRAAAWYPVTAARQWSAGIGRLNASGSYTLLVRFEDRAGNVKTVLTPFKIR
jgi:hypothetical protein